MSLIFLLALVLVFFGVVGLPMLILLMVFPKTRSATFSLFTGGGLFIIFLLMIFWQSNIGEFKSISDAPADAYATPPAAMTLESEIPLDDDPASEPDWVDAESGTVGDVYRMSIAVGPYSTREEIDQHLPDALQKSLDRYVGICFVGEEIDRRLILPADYLQGLVEKQWEETREYSVGPMITLHVLLEFDRKARDRVVDERRRLLVADRIWYAGLGFSAWIVILSVAYSTLKLSLGKSADKES